MTLSHEARHKPGWKAPLEAERGDVRLEDNAIHGWDQAKDQVAGPRFAGGSPTWTVIFHGKARHDREGREKCSSSACGI